MNNKIIRQDFKKNKVVWLATILFITAASMLLSLAAILTVNLSGTIDRLMLDSKTPHFMQMHSGQLDMDKVQAFADGYDGVEDFQVINFLNIDNSQIILGGNSLASSIQDNGVCVQSDRFDFLLDLDNKPAHPHKGELYVPVCYYRDKTAEVGDEALIGGQTFTIAGFVRDSQMNSTLASSKRFVVSADDYSRLETDGNVEYLIEFRLKDTSRLGAFEAAYNDAGLPANGPALTWPLFQMISAVSDGIMIAVIILIGALVIFIAMLCVRFTLLAKIEDDYREIGVMKAVGMRLSDIRSIYLAIYAVIAAAGCILGFPLALILQAPLRKSIRLNLGENGNNTLALALGVIGAVLVFLLILLYVNFSLRHFRNISAVQAIRFGSETGSVHGGRKIRLSNNRLLSTNLFLGIKDVLSRKKLYATMLVVVILAAFIMIVPQNLYQTISDDNFVTYIGVGSCDLRLDIQQTDKIDKKAQAIGNCMDEDEGISQYAVLTSKIFPLKLDDGTFENIKVELGDHTVFPIQYASGRMPVAEDEIALSSINAEELETNVGEQITLVTSNGEMTLTICGIYSDITNGGKTAKAVFTDESTSAAWSVICANLSKKEQLNGKIAEYADCFPYAKISGIDAYMTQTFGQTLKSVRAASFTAILVSAAITLLVTLLFMRLLAAKDHYAIAVLRSVGFTRSDIRRQYAWRAAFILAVGIVSGTILAGTVGEKLSALAISSFGAATFQFTINPLFTCLLSPLILIAAAMLATILGTSHAGDVKLCESIKE